jgi:tetratricopeptide (TPR) repeat protein
VRYLTTVVTATTLISALAACSAKQADSAPVTTDAAAAPATPASTDKIPVTTASAEAKTHYLQGRALSDQLRVHDAHVEFAQAAALDPTFAMAHYNLALCSSTAKEFFDEVTKAVALIDKASDGERLMILALQAGANADPQKSQQYAEQLVAKYPGDERAHFTLGNAYFGRQNYEPAIREFKRAIEINPSYSPAYNSLGYAYRPVGNNADAEVAFKKYIELVPNDPNPYDSYAELLMKTGRFDESIVQYRKALSIDPHFSSSHLGIAADHMFQDNTDQAIAEARVLYDNARDDADRRNAEFEQVMIYVDAGQTAKALAHMNAEHAIAERIADTANMAADNVAMGDILLDAGRPDEAHTHYERSKSLILASSATPDVKADAKLAYDYDLSRVALAKGNIATAKALSADYLAGAQARHNDFRIRQAHTLAASIAIAEKQYDAAIADLSESNQQNPYVLYLTGLAYQGKGDAAKAKENFGWAANMDVLPSLQYVFIRKKARALA